ncbi:MAG: polysulfide reductase NrfD, partial [Desulfobulbaceae bacterium]|nr:polysulfide reductase NrfD [Desulfobulbaceae bacterium]
MSAGHGDVAVALTNYVFPNDLHVHWSLMIVLYPYITGIVAGAFIVSSMYHVFKIEALKPIARFSLVFALAFLACATMPLLNHLTQPFRALNMMLTPNPSSAMAGFGYIYSAYAIVLILEIIFIYRETLVKAKAKASGGMKTLYTILTIGSDNVSEKALALDHKIISFLAAIGIPMACVLHGYVGFIFGGVKANPLWATPLMPVIFL